MTSWLLKLNVSYNCPRDYLQGDHFYRKPGNVGDFDSWQWNVWDKWPKTVYCLLAAYLHPYTLSYIDMINTGDERDRWGKPDYLLVFKIVLTLLRSCISFSFRMMHSCIPTPTSDNNTGTGTIWATLNTGRSAANRQGLSHCRDSSHPVLVPFCSKIGSFVCKIS